MNQLIRWGARCKLGACLPSSPSNSSSGPAAAAPPSHMPHVLQSPSFFLSLILSTPPSIPSPSSTASAAATVYSPASLAFAPTPTIQNPCLCPQRGAPPPTRLIRDSRQRQAVPAPPLLAFWDNSQRRPPPIVHAVVAVGTYTHAHTPKSRVAPPLESASVSRGSPHLRR